MINRELIRIKVVQLTYAYYQNGNRNIDVAEKELLFSLSKAYHLYHHLLALIVAISQEARKYYEVENAKAERENTPLPSSKFVNNRFAIQLEYNKQLCEFVSNQKHTWADDIEFVRKMYSLIIQSNTYISYMSESTSSYEADRELWRKLYKDLIMENDDLDALLEEQSLYWNDDKEIVDTFVLKTIKRFEPTSKANQELLPEYKDEDDKTFARKLFRATILNADQYQRYMGDTSYNWDFSRLAYMDVVIMQIAIAEMLTFPNIPISVTINEYVNLAKTYSTPKSAGYINGMLDTIARHLIEKGTLLKPMGDNNKEQNNKTEQ
ncbi:MAG: transcription antitermination factor NusB [Prevotella sp.]|nr:transcription antitermination factor NusB [Prevotella sp.]